MRTISQPLSVQEVAAVDDERIAHPLAERLPVELGELRPLGHEHRRVGALQRLLGRSGELNAGQQLGGGALGHGVVAAHRRALAVEPGRQDQARRLAHVVGVRLERQSEERDRLAGERAEVLLELPDHPSLLELVDLDDGRQELEVVAGVAGELFER